MSIPMILLLAAGVSMDAFAASVCKGIQLKVGGAKEAVIVGLWFALFQGGFPFIGYLIGSRISPFAEHASCYVAFGLLCLLGVLMLKDGITHKDIPAAASLSVKNMCLLSVAISIDALSAGVAFAFVPPRIFAGKGAFFNSAAACVIIALVTFAFSAAGVFLGERAGRKSRDCAQIIGGILLIGIGTEVLLEGLGIIAG